MYRPHHFHSIMFDIMKAKAQVLYVNVILLEKPLGFENPFLDKVTSKCLNSREFVVEEGLEHKTYAKVQWELPVGSICTSVRVQLRGVHTMSLNGFKAFLGDNYVQSNENQVRGRLHYTISLHHEYFHAAFGCTLERCD